MEKKILKWVEESDFNVKKIEKICVGEIITWLVHIDTYMIHKVDLKLAGIKGIKITVIEAITTPDGKFNGFGLWINEK